MKESKINNLKVLKVSFVDHCNKEVSFFYTDKSMIDKIGKEGQCKYDDVWYSDKNKKL